MTVKEFLELCGNDNMDKRGIVNYFDFSGRLKHANIVSLHEDYVEIDPEAERIKISFKAPYNNEDDESDTISLKEFYDLVIQNNGLDYSIEHSVIFDKYNFESSHFIRKENVGFDGEGWIYLCY